MGQLAAVENRQDFLSPLERTTEPLPCSPAYSPYFCREIGLAIVANALKIPINDFDDFDPEVGEAIRRGARYALLMLKARTRADAA